jgi:hypothetical protein
MRYAAGERSPEGTGVYSLGSSLSLATISIEFIYFTHHS